MTSPHIDEYTDFPCYREMRFQIVEWARAADSRMDNVKRGRQEISDGHLTGFVVFGMPHCVQRSRPKLLSSKISALSLSVHHRKVPFGGLWTPEGGKTRRKN